MLSPQNKRHSFECLYRLPMLGEFHFSSIFNQRPVPVEPTVSIDTGPMIVFNT